MFEGPIKLIKGAKKISLLTHKDAGGDGDALGSLLSFSFALSKLDREIYPVLDETISSNFSFLPGLEMLDKEIRKDVDLVILLDFADLKRGSFTPPPVPSILIDHHPRGDLYNSCTFKIHDEKAASTTEILYFLINQLGVPIDKEIAHALLVGIFSDTNGFQNPNTTPRTLGVASSLLSHGVRIESIAKHIFYDKSTPVLKLWGRAMSRLWRNEKYNLLVTALHSSDFLECGAERESAEGLVNFLSLTTIPSASGILFLVEENGRIKGSLRTQKEGVDVSRLAQILGGGGHKKAAGFEVEGGLKNKEGAWKIV